MKSFEDRTTSYRTPEIETFAAAEIIEALGPARAGSEQQSQCFGEGCDV